MEISSCSWLAGLSGAVRRFYMILTDYQRRRASASRCVALSGWTLRNRLRTGAKCPVYCAPLRAIQRGSKWVFGVGHSRATRVRSRVSRAHSRKLRVRTNTPSSFPPQSPLTTMVSLPVGELCGQHLPSVLPRFFFRSRPGAGLGVGVGPAPTCRARIPPCSVSTLKDDDQWPKKAH